MYKVEFLLDGRVEDFLNHEILEDALKTAARWVEDAGDLARDWDPNSLSTYQPATVRVIQPKVFFEVEI